MLQGYNTLRYFEDQTLQRWETADNQNILVYFAINKIPAFVLVSDTAETTATVQMFNALTDVAFGAAKTVTVTTSGTKKILFFAGFTLTGGADGCYYSKIVTGASVETYYSEVFHWTADSASNRKELGLLKISAVSSDITMGNTHTIPLTGFTFECMINVEPPIIEPEITERGDEKPFGDIAVFNTRVLKYTFDLIGTKDIMEFLSGLRILKTNGTITFTYNGEVMDAYDIVFEKGDSTYFDEAISMTLQFKQTNYISARNAV